MIAGPARPRFSLVARVRSRRIDYLAVVELAALAISGPLLVFPNRFSLIALVLLPSVWLLRLWLRRARSRQSPADWPLAGLLLMTCVSLYASVDLALSRPKLFGMILGFFVFTFLVEHLRAPAEAAALALALIVGGVAVAAVGFVGTSWSQSKIAILTPLYIHLPHLIAGVTTSFGTSTPGFQPNEVGGTLVLVFPVALGLALFAFDRRIRLASAAAFGVMASALVLTASRSALAGAVAALLLLTIARWRRAAYGLPAAAAAAVVAFGLIGPERVAGWLLAMQATPGVGDTEATRIEIWSRALSMIQDFPYTGIGLNTFPVVVNLLYPLFLTGPDSPPPHAHDLFLQTAVDFGVPGLACFLAILAAAGVSLARSWRRSGGWQRGLVVGLSAGLVGHLSFGLIDAVTLGAKPGVFLWTILGGSIAVGLDGREVNRRGPGVARWVAWFFFAVACALGVLIQVTGLKILP